jgi:outer membrane protein assembly factor BamD
MTLSSASMRAAAALAASIALISLTGCRTNREADDPARSAPSVVYERAQQAMQGQDFQNAIRVLEALVARYPFAAETRQARLDLIYAYYKARESESAIDAADTFIRENPTHPRVDYAWYLKGLVEFERAPNVVERFFRVDLDERPPQTAQRSFAAFRKVVEDYPKSEYAHDSRRRMIHLRNRLADYQLYVARYYMDRGAWVAAAQRAKETVERYDGAPAVREALEIMIQCYDRLQLADLAQQTRQVYAANYGGDSGSGRGGSDVGRAKRPWWKPWG